MTLDPIMCEWCTENTPAAARTHQWNTNQEGSFNSYLCSTHCQEVASEFTTVTLHPLTGYTPEYTALETYASPMDTEYTVRELELAARYGSPYPVCGDLTTKKRNKMMLKMIINAEFAKTQKSWVGHDPSGEQY